MALLEVSCASRGRAQGGVGLLRVQPGGVSCRASSEGNKADGSRQWQEQGKWQVAGEDFAKIFTKSNVPTWHVTDYLILLIRGYMALSPSPSPVQLTCPPPFTHYCCSPSNKARSITQRSALQ